MSITSFRIIDSTLREGEQFALAHFTIDEKLAIAAALERLADVIVAALNPAEATGRHAAGRATSDRDEQHPQQHPI